MSSSRILSSNEFIAFILKQHGLDFKYDEPKGYNFNFDFKNIDEIPVLP